MIFSKLSRFPVYSARALARIVSKYKENLDKLGNKWNKGEKLAETERERERERVLQYK